MSNKQILLEKDIKIIKVLKKTRAKMLENCIEGDTLKVSVPFKSVGGNRGRSYSVSLAIHNVRLNETIYKTFNECWLINDIFELEEFYPIATRSAD